MAAYTGSIAAVATTTSVATAASTAYTGSIAAVATIASVATTASTAYTGSVAAIATTASVATIASSLSSTAVTWITGSRDCSRDGHRAWCTPVSGIASTVSWVARTTIRVASNVCWLTRTTSSDACIDSRSLGLGRGHDNNRGSLAMVRAVVRVVVLKGSHSRCAGQQGSGEG